MCCIVLSREKAMVKIETVLRELFEGELAGGRDFYWTHGSKTTVSVEWNHRAAGREWSEPEIHEYTAQDFGQYITNEWPEYKIVNVEDLG